jgi:hypothetical protein
MTVEELIKELKKFNPKMLVVLDPEDSDIGTPIINLPIECGDVVRISRGRILMTQKEYENARKKLDELGKELMKPTWTKEQAREYEHIVKTIENGVLKRSEDVQDD